MKITTSMIVGEVGVDSGQIMIVDPCYVLDDDFVVGGKPTGGKYDAICRMTLSGKGYGEVADGFATGTLGGDGTYPIIAELNDRGQIVRLTIDFAYDDDNYELEEDDE